MRVICITGGIGAGKSTVCEYFKSKGVAVYSSDIRAKQLMREDAQLVQSIKTLFGEQAYFPDGTVNSAIMAQTIFSSPVYKSRLEAIVHPAVQRDFERWKLSQLGPFVIKESALSIEINDQSCEELVVVLANESTRIRRLQVRNPNWSLDHIRSRMLNQSNDEQRRNAATLLIENNAGLEELYAQLDQLLIKWS
jgi:dephospho-CoA kinase